MLRDIKVKNVKLGKEISIQVKINLVETKFDVQQTRGSRSLQLYVSHVQKEF